MNKLCLILLGLVASVYANSCYEPTIPQCVYTYSDTFDYPDNYDSCKDKVEYYLRENKKYISCLQDSVNEAIHDRNKVINRFNCKASHGEDMQACMNRF